MTYELILMLAARLQRNDSIRRHVSTRDVTSGPHLFSDHARKVFRTTHPHGGFKAGFDRFFT